MRTLCWLQRERAESCLEHIRITDEFHAGILKQAGKHLFSQGMRFAYIQFGTEGSFVIWYDDLHYHNEMLCIDEFEKMKSAKIWKGQQTLQHFCF